MIHDNEEIGLSFVFLRGTAIFNSFGKTPVYNNRHAFASMDK